jgi:hypothetical protein
MNKILQEKLFKKYPKIFRQRKLSPKETAMCWGIDCNDGWYMLLDCLCSKLQWDTDKNNKTCKYPQVEATQVKQKFGTLRFYVTGAKDAQWGAIELAELMSAYICEHCGKFTENTKSTTGYIQTLCQDCYKKETK